MDLLPLSNRGMQRIFDYASRLMSDEGKFSPNDMWARIGEGHVKFVECCVKRDEATFVDMTCNIAKTPLVRGFMNYFHYSVLVSNQSARKAEATQFVDRLLSVAEYLGIIRALESVRSL